VVGACGGAGAPGLFMVVALRMVEGEDWAGAGAVGAGAVGAGAATVGVVLVAEPPAPVVEGRLVAGGPLVGDGWAPRASPLP
jgi:hypothetical protein